MKKKIVALSLALVLMVACLTGCGKNGIEGTYKLDSISVSGMTVSVNDETAKSLGITADSITMTINDGSKGVFTLNKENADFTYAVDGNKIKITVDNETKEGTIDGNKITIEIDGQSMTLIKK